MMRLLKLLAWLILLASLVPPLALLAAFQDEPLVSTNYRLNQENVSRIKVVLRDANPRWLRIGDNRELSLVEDDFNLILNYGMAQVLPGSVDVELHPGAAHVDLSIVAGSVFKGRYFNTRFDVTHEGRSVVPSSWYLGNLKVPDGLSRFLASRGHKVLMSWAQYRAALEALEELELSPGQIRVKYHWRQELKDQLRVTGRQLLFDERDQQRLSFYHEKIFQLSLEVPRRVSLTPLVAALFDSAARQSPTAADAVVENRALLLALAFHIARIDVNHFLTEPGRSLNYFWLLRPTLADRHDLAQHFVISAGIAASAGNGIAAAAGLFKELKDSQGGSGFSFADLAADRAGSRMAELALDPRWALSVQQHMRSARSERAYMPGISDLPEGIQRLDFTRRYENLDNEAYALVTAEIERRIAACSLYAMLL